MTMSTIVAPKRDSLVVGISDMKVSNNPSDIIVTHSLGSCLGITAYDPEKKVGGMVHCLLPLSMNDPEQAKTNPYMFVDTGTIELLNKVIAMGAVKERLIIKVAGGAQMMDNNGVFNIGSRNFTTFRKIMWKNKLLIAAQDVGGMAARTLRLFIEDGKVSINMQAETQL